MVKEAKDARELEQMLMQHCAELPIEAVRVHSHWRFGWHARYISAPDVLDDIRPRFEEIVDGLRQRYILANRR